MRNIWIDETRKRSVRIGQGQKDAAESGELQTSSDSEKTADADKFYSRLRFYQKSLARFSCSSQLKGTVMSRLTSARVKLRAALADPKGAHR